MTIPEPVSPTVAPPVWPAAKRERKGFRLGLWSLILGIIAPVWAVSAILLAIREGSMHDFPDQEPLYPAWASGLIYAYTIVGAIVVPLAVIATIVLGIFALVRNRRPGQVLGALGLFTIILSIAGIVALVVWFFSVLANVSG